LSRKDQSYQNGIGKLVTRVRGGGVREKSSKLETPVLSITSGKTKKGDSGEEKDSVGKKAVTNRHETKKRRKKETDGEKTKVNAN